MRDLILIPNPRSHKQSKPRGSLHFKPGDKQIADHVSVRKSNDPGNYWLNYKYAIIFTLIILSITVAVVDYLFF